MLSSDCPSNHRLKKASTDFENLNFSLPYRKKNKFKKLRMRPLHGDETKAFFEKLANYIGSENIPRLLNRSEGTYLFLLHKERVFYVSEKIAKYAGSCARENLISFGVCFGKFTKTKKFRLQITALDYLAPYAQYKIWVKPSSEQSFLYGNHVLKKRVLTPQMILT